MEQLLKQKLKVMRKKLRKIEQSSDAAQQQQETIKLKQRMWIATGLYKYDFAPEALKKVVENQARIGLCPRGYMYPELHLSTDLPTELKQMLLRAKVFES